MVFQKLHRNVFLMFDCNTDCNTLCNDDISDTKNNNSDDDSDLHMHIQQNILYPRQKVRDLLQ